MKPCGHQCNQPLLLIYHQGLYTQEQVTAMAKAMYTGNIGKVASVTGELSTVEHLKLDGYEKFHKMSDTSRVTRKITEIFHWKKAKNPLLF